jgi:hypothetical protein
VQLSEITLVLSLYFSTDLSTSICFLFPINLFLQVSEAWLVAKPAGGLSTKTKKTSR